MENTHTERESMIFYKSFFEAIEDLPGDEFKKCACAIFNYGLKGEMPETTGFEKAIMVLIKPQIDKNTQRWMNAKKSHGTKKADEEQKEHCAEEAQEKEQEKETAGEYGNVLLTESEKDELIRTLGKDRYSDSVSFLSKYIKRKPGYQSACHFEDLRGWVQDAIDKKKDKSPPKPINPSFDFNLEDYCENFR